MNRHDDPVGRALRDAAGPDTPEFSPALHARVVRELSRDAIAAPAVPWAWGDVARRHGPAVAAMVLLAVAVAAWIYSSSSPKASAPVVVSLPLPDVVVGSGMRSAEAGLNALMETHELASLDQEAVRFTGFVVDQLSFVPTRPLER